MREARRYALRCAPDHPRPDDIALVTLELGTNAVEHGVGDKYLITVECTDDGVWISVVNDAVGDGPALRAPGWLDVHGRGLKIVGRLGCFSYEHRAAPSR